LRGAHRVASFDLAVSLPQDLSGGLEPEAVTAIVRRGDGLGVHSYFRGAPRAAGFRHPKPTPRTAPEGL
jgi:hypothetical protein